MSIFTSASMLTVASALMLVAITIVGLLIIRPGFRRVSRDRRRQLQGRKRPQQATTLATATDFATDQIGKILEKPKNAPAPAPVPVKPPPTTATVTQDTSKAGGATVTEVAKVESKTDAPLGDDETDD